MSFKNEKQVDHLLKLIKAAWPQGAEGAQRNELPASILKAFAHLKEEVGHYGVVWPESAVLEKLSHTVDKGFLPYLVEIDKDSLSFPETLTESEPTISYDILGLASQPEKQETDKKISLNITESSASLDISQDASIINSRLEHTITDFYEELDDGLGDLDFADMLDHQKSQAPTVFSGPHTAHFDFQADSSVERDSHARSASEMVDFQSDTPWPEQAQDIEGREKDNTEENSQLNSGEGYRQRALKTQVAHALIEGESYHMLTALQATHQSLIDWVYIDPPSSGELYYNREKVGPEDTYRQSKWLSFMKKRLKLTYPLLSERAITFLSVEENDLASLRLLCDDIWGAGNFVSLLSWRKNRSYKARHIAQVAGYILVYAKDKSQCQFQAQAVEAEGGLQNFLSPKITSTVQEAKQELKSLLGLSGNSNTSVLENSQSLAENSVVSTPAPLTPELIDQIDLKPVALLRYLLKIASSAHSVCLDLFAGSGTALEALVRLNAADQGLRQLIMGVDAPENRALITARLEKILSAITRSVMSGNRPQKSEAGRQHPQHLSAYRLAFMSYDTTQLEAQAVYMKNLEPQLIIQNNLGPYAALEADDNYTLYGTIGDLLNVDNQTVIETAGEDSDTKVEPHSPQVIFIHRPDDFLFALNDYIEDDYEEEEIEGDNEMGTSHVQNSVAQKREDALKQDHIERQDKYRVLIKANTVIYLFNYFKNNRFDAENDAFLTQEFITRYPHNPLWIGPKNFINRLVKA